MSQSNQTSPQTFEAAMQELETLVAEMETGDLPLEQALSKFERGISLARTSQDILKKAEQRVRILTNEDGKESLSNVNVQDLD